MRLALLVGLLCFPQFGTAREKWCADSSSRHPQPVNVSAAAWRQAGQPLFWPGHISIVRVSRVSSMDVSPSN